MPKALSKKHSSPKKSARKRIKPTATLTKSPRRIPVGDIINPALAALGREHAKVVEFLKDVATGCKPRDGGDSDPTHDRMLEYATSRDSRSRCGADFAAAVLDYLHNHASRIQDANAAKMTRELCTQVLISQRERRYERPLGSDSVSVDRLDLFLGAYAVSRLETSDKTPRQELLLLARDSKKSAHTYATYITPEVVDRGRWYVVGQTIWCPLTGRRSSYDYDIINVCLAKNTQKPKLMGGFLAGTATHVRFPTVVPVLAIKIDAATPETLRLADNADGPLRDAISKIQKEIFDAHNNGTFLIELLPRELLDVPMMEPTALTSSIQSKIRDDGTSLIAPPLLEFCRSRHDDFQMVR